MKKIKNSIYTDALIEGVGVLAFLTFLVIGSVFLFA